ncbi:MAG TPA: hypothetical protein VI636_05115 [Candidatus Angelobacter sp.]
MADQEKQLDPLLDSLLANYADAEPRPGFETRLLAALREPKPGLRFGWLWAGAATMVTAAAVFAVYNSRLAELPPPPRIEAARPPVFSLPGTVVVRDATRHPEKLQIGPPALVSVAGVRQEVFPSPIPLSEQERLLLRYLAGTPRDEVASHAREDEPVEKTDPARPESQRPNSAEVFSTR